MLASGVCCSLSGVTTAPGLLQPWRRMSTSTCAGRSRCGLVCMPLHSSPCLGCMALNGGLCCCGLKLAIGGRPVAFEPVHAAPDCCCCCGFHSTLQFFLQGNECRLSISGFYYMAVHRCARPAARCCCRYLGCCRRGRCTNAVLLLLPNGHLPDRTQSPLLFAKRLAHGLHAFPNGTHVNETSLVALVCCCPLLQGDGRCQRLLFRPLLLARPEPQPEGSAGGARRLCLPRL